jgi:uncharacterized protein
MAHRLRLGKRPGRLEGMITGFATVEGTAGYFNSRKELGGWLDGAGLHCSRVGLGTYRIDDHTAAHSEAIKTALLSGCNLIDTSTNYSDGESEAAIGKAVNELIKVGVIDRDQLILVSKVGYVQGAALRLAAEREAAGNPFPEMVKYQEGCWHCIHPDYLAVQLEKTRERLGVECVDFYLLHNPEYFLMDAAKKGSGVLLPKLRETFYDRVRGAFEFLETAVAQGKIQGYGVSSNTLGASPHRADATSAATFLEVAESVAKAQTGSEKNHHFRLYQLPLNLFESGPYLEKNTGEGSSLTALEFATKNHLAVLANRPLNAFAKQSLVRLAEFPQRADGQSFAELFSALGVLEAEFAQSIAPTLHLEAGMPPANALFRWSQDLKEVEKVSLGIDRWSQIENQILFHMNQLCEEIRFQLDSKEWDVWSAKYNKALKQTLLAFRARAGEVSGVQSKEAAVLLDPFLPIDWQKETLSRKALGTLIHTPGVSCVLNGMRTADYVHDSMGAVTLPRLSEIAVRKIFNAFRQTPSA